MHRPLPFDLLPSRLERGAPRTGGGWRIAQPAALRAGLQMKIVLRAMAEIFDVLDVEIVDREPHTQIFGANSHFVLLQTFPSSFPRKREPRAARTRRSPGPPLGRG